MHARPSVNSPIVTADAIVLWADGMKAEASDAVVDEAHKRKLKVFAACARACRSQEPGQGKCRWADLQHSGSRS